MKDLEIMGLGAATRFITSFSSRHQSGSVGSGIAFRAIMDCRSFAIVIVALRGWMV